MVSPHLVEVTDSPIHTISTSIHAFSTSAIADRMDTKKRRESSIDVSTKIYCWGNVVRSVVPGLADVPVRSFLDDGLLAGQVELFDNLVDSLWTLVNPRAYGDDVLVVGR